LICLLDGEAYGTRNPKDYFAMMRDFILHGRLDARCRSTSTVYRPATELTDSSKRH
jgi:hypothetical protein